MNGTQFLAKLRDEGNLTPFILFTSQSSENIAIQALGVGTAYLKKAIDIVSQFDKLVEIIHNLIRQEDELDAAMGISEQNGDKSSDFIPGIALRQN